MCAQVVCIIYILSQIRLDALIQRHLKINHQHSFIITHRITRRGKLGDGQFTVLQYSYPEEQTYGKMEKANENDKEENSKDGADDPAHVHLLLVRDEGRGYDVGHEQEVDYKVEDYQGDGVLVLPQETTPINWL